MTSFEPRPDADIPHCSCPLPWASMSPGIRYPRRRRRHHAHVVAGDAGIIPRAAERTTRPRPRPEQMYLDMPAARRRNARRAAQISVYGTDNRYMLEVLRRHPDQLRGIGVVGPDVTDRELQNMHAAGVRGLRLNVLFGGGIGFDAMETLAHRTKDMGWHMQFLMDARQLPELLPKMRKLPVPGVVDHMGHMPVAEGLQSAGFQALRHMLVDHGWWAKLSGAYRISTRFDAYEDVTPWARALIAAAPDRVVWGSDWPHVHISPMVDTGRLRNQLAAWAPEPELRRRILVSNPQRLYDFPAVQGPFTFHP